MDLQEAFTTLELPPNATAEEFRLKYRELSKKFHPDRPEGDSEVQAQLNEAERVLSNHFTSHNQFTVVMEQSLVEFKRNLESERAKRVITETAIRIVRREIRPPRRIRTLSIVFAGIAALAGWFSADLSFLIPQFLAPSMKVAAVVFAAYAAILQFRIAQFKEMVEDLKQDLSDPFMCGRALARLMRYEAAERLRFRDVLYGLEPDYRGIWLSFIDRFKKTAEIFGFLPLSIPRIDRANLLVSNCVASGLLEELPRGGDGILRLFQDAEYQVLFHPEEYLRLEGADYRQRY